MITVVKKYNSLITGQLIVCLNEVHDVGEASSQEQIPLRGLFQGILQDREADLEIHGMVFQPTT